MTHDPETKIVLALPRSQKGRYVAASRAAGLTLAAWMFARLDEASEPFPPSLDDDAPGGPQQSLGDDPRPG